MDLIDSHCHLDAAEFDRDRDEVVARSRDQGVRHIVVPAVDVASWERISRLYRRQDGIFPAFGLHPVYIEQHQEADLGALEKRLAEERPAAVGEIGLDYYVRELDRTKQQQFFEAQLGMARDAQLPVILHVRKAHDQVLATLKRLHIHGGTAHAFNGSLQQARQYIDLGFKLGFGGMLTFERSNKLRRLARELPLEAIVLETDAPDMTVCSHRGERNSPEYLPECLAALAEVRAGDRDALAEQTRRNTLDALQLERWTPAGKHHEH